MGNASSTTTITTALTSIEEEGVLQQAVPQQLLQGRFAIDISLVPGSGRLMRTYRVRSSSSSSSATVTNTAAATTTTTTTPADATTSVSHNTGPTAVIKAMWWIDDTSSTNTATTATTTITKQTSPDLARYPPLLREYALELERLATALLKVVPDDGDTTTTTTTNTTTTTANDGKDTCSNFTAAAHILPFSAWLVGDSPLSSTGSTTTAAPATAATMTLLMMLGKSQYRPVCLIRPYIYTTLADRMASRPWYHLVEKMALIRQLLQALDYLHSCNVVEDDEQVVEKDSTTNQLRRRRRPLVHGGLTTENIGLTSSGWLVLMDLANGYKPPLTLPDDDPSLYLFYFEREQQQSQQSQASSQRNNTSSGSTTTRGGGGGSSSNSRRCYLAPERFYTPSHHQASTTSTTTTNPTTSLTDDAVPDDTGKGTTSSLIQAAKSTTPSTETTPFVLTPAMDLFSAGCVMVELLLNGERCFDLGELLEYRRLNNTTTYESQPQQRLTPTLKQRLDKIESSALRAACRHMLHVNPRDRLPRARDYLERLEQAAAMATTKRHDHDEEDGSGTYTTSSTATDGAAISSPTVSSGCETAWPTCALELVTRVVEQVTVQGRFQSPDARLVLAARWYPRVLWETVGKVDTVGQSYVQKVLGCDPKNQLLLPSSLSSLVSPGEENGTASETEKTRPQDASTQPSLLPSMSPTDQLFAETDALLRQLESLNVDDILDVHSNVAEAHTTTSDESKVAEDSIKPVTAERSPMSKSCLVIYLQLILSLVRHVQRPASKMVALQLMLRLALYSSDEARLQRIVPSTVSLLQDQDALVRACALRVVTKTLALIESFSPSDAQVFPQYILKRVAHLISDPSLCCRLAVAECLAALAETAHLFLDISNAVRLYEAVGSGSSGGTTTPLTGVQDKRNGESKSRHDDTNIFGDDVAKLLDTSNQSTSKQSKQAPEPTESAASSVTPSSSDYARVAAGKTLINSTYQVELASLQDTVSRWIIQITTDQAESSAFPKRALLSDIGRLCNFFGLDGVMSSVLPLILAFLNDRKNWELRAALFDALPSVCQIIGRAATEEFVVPCVEIGLVDEEEHVISTALSCLSRLIEMRLLSRIFLLGAPTRGESGRNIKSLNSSVLKRYAALLIHPVEIVRSEAIKTFANAYDAVGSPDAEVYINPIVQPFLRFNPSPGSLASPFGMERCLQSAWPYERFSGLLEKCAADFAAAAAATEGAWTSVAIQLSEDGNVSEGQDTVARINEGSHDKDGAGKDPQTESVMDYLRMLVRHTGKPTSKGTSSSRESNVGLAGGIEGSAKLAQSIMFPRQDSVAQKATVPDWYTSLRDLVEREKSIVSETAAIQSVSTLGHIYGLSIMGPLEGTTENIVGAADDSKDIEAATYENVLRKPESKTLEIAYTGQWGSEALVEPDIVDTSLLLTKLKALEVPPLPPNLGDKVQPPMASPARASTRDGPPSAEWKPRVNALIAKSSPSQGHTAAVVRLAVSLDNTFFVSGSHDGTCRVWETSQLEDSAGVLESSLVYSGHSTSNVRPARVNDIALVERSHSVVSGDSNGVVRVWRVDTVASSAGKATTLQQGADGTRKERSRTVGTSDIRQVEPEEGEILAVSHFNSPSASIITFATQKGRMHSWDLRSAREPFVLRHGPELGHLTAAAMGSDRHWIVTGTSRGYLTLWDVRFQQIAKLWRHSRMAPIHRLATSEVAPPQTWGTRAAASADTIRPFLFAASGPNECAMFDAITGACRECFRTVAGDSRELHAHVEEPPRLFDVPISTKSTGASPATKQPIPVHQPLTNSIHCMAGSIGGSSHSFLLTGGSDGRIRYWDFSTPSKCFVVSGTPSHMQQPRPSFERIDFEGQTRVMLCRQPRLLSHGGLRGESSQQLHNNSSFSSGAAPSRKPEWVNHNNFTDSIQDIKILDGALVSCSRDCTIRVFR